MCGRIEYIVTDKKKLEDHYGATLIEGYTDQGFTYPRYNIPPMAHTPIVTSESTGEIQMGHWGYLPEWAKDGGREVINARSETVFAKPYFQKSIASRRCLIPVTGFFEWRHVGKSKTPYRFHLNGDIFSLGGLYTIIEDENGVEMPHYAIITTKANELMEPVHDRMPLVIPKVKESRWINKGTEEKDLLAFFRPVDYALMQRDQISSLVNSVRNDNPEILRPVVH